MTKIPSPYKYKKIFWTLFLACSFMFIFYLSLVGKTVANVVQRQQDERALAETSANVSKFEFAYLNEKSSINATLANSMGFVPVADQSVAKAKEVGRVSLNNEIQ